MIGGSSTSSLRRALGLWLSTGGAVLLLLLWALADTHSGVALQERAGSPPGESHHVHPPQAPSSTADTLRFEGEFGLAVHLERDSLRVRWVTLPSAPGRLRAKAGGSVVHEASTPSDTFHTVAFALPDTDHVLLDYGAGADDPRMHSTLIHLDFDRARPPAEVDGVDTLFVVADIHGEYDHMIRVFRNAGLIDDEGGWAAGGSHLAVLGDMMSRGMDATAVVWFLYRLEREAEAAGGRVHVVLGNHEFMVMLEDLRYVQPKELWVADGHGIGYDRLFDPRYSVLGRWLVSKPVVIRLDDLLMAHGGVSREYATHTLESLRDSVSTYLDDDLFYHWADTTVPIAMDSAAFERRVDLYWGERSPIWYRGYALSDTLDQELEEVLRAFDSRIHVIGHTPVSTIREAYGGSVILVNTHPFADQVLRLIRTDGGYERVRIPQDGSPLPLDTGIADEVTVPEG